MVPNGPGTLDGCWLENHFNNEVQKRRHWQLPKEPHELTELLCTRLILLKPFSWTPFVILLRRTDYISMPVEMGGANYVHSSYRHDYSVKSVQAEFLSTTYSRIKSRALRDQLLFCFQEPYATVVLVAREGLDEFKIVLKSRLKLILQNE
ncbi:hypothetical protein L1987_81397 [Smallanthus sonchifolius]|uniref:Uncharacterized protein n=1 Tax=Smallanthus sonchifolius TaxID=185202 RepID=A0ACB8YQH1_9ASTR|nr:hypothetical protein L1987_81397 [Smallanthus sonchifolius]